MMIDPSQPLNVKRLESRAEEAAMGELATQSFNFPDSSWEVYPEIVGRENMRIASVAGEMVGGMCMYPAGQWFAGRSVPMSAFALVMTAPQHRGHGYGFGMCVDVMREMRATHPLAALHASTQQFYRKLGFEQAGNAYDYACSLKDIHGCRAKLPMRRADPAGARQVLQALATKRAVASNGCLDRNDGLWKRLFRERGGKVFTYLVGSAGNESGYLIYEQCREAGRSSAAEQQWEQRSIVIRDMVALSAEALETIWAFVAANRTVTEMVRWTGPAADPRNLVTSEYEPKVHRPRRWMLRLLDVRAALLQRGYPKLTADVSFDVSDELFEENAGRFNLRLIDGVPEITEDTVGEPIRLTVQDFAPMYSGLWTATQLQMIGKLACGNAALVSKANQVFACSEPWMPDAF